MAEAFSEGREVIENLPHMSRSSTSANEHITEKIKETVLENCHIRISVAVDNIIIIS